MIPRLGKGLGGLARTLERFDVFLGGRVGRQEIRYVTFAGPALLEARQDVGKMPRVDVVLFQVA